MADAHIALRLQFASHPQQINQRFGFHLVHKVSAVNLYRELADSKFGSNLFVKPTFNDFRHNLLFARSQLCKTVSRFEESCFGSPPQPILVNSSVNGIYQILMAERLGQEINRASLDGANRHHDVAMPCNKNNWESNF